MSAMSAMVNFEIPWINVLSKMDLVTPTKNDDDPDGAGARNGPRGRRDVARLVLSSKLRFPLDKYITFFA